MLIIKSQVVLMVLLIFSFLVSCGKSNETDPKRSSKSPYDGILRSLPKGEASPKLFSICQKNKIIPNNFLLKKLKKDTKIEFKKNIHFKFNISRKNSTRKYLNGNEVKSYSKKDLSPWDKKGSYCTLAFNIKNFKKGASFSYLPAGLHVIKVVKPWSAVGYIQIKLNKKHFKEQNVRKDPELSLSSIICTLKEDSKPENVTINDLKTAMGLDLSLNFCKK